MSKRVLIIGAGGVGSVVAHKCAQTTEFQDICIACRNEERAKKLAAQLTIGRLGRSGNGLI